MICKNLSVTTLNTSTPTAVCRIRKQIFINKRYACNFGQSNFDLLADYIQAKIIIIFAINLDLFERQSDAVV